MKNNVIEENDKFRYINIVIRIRALSYKLFTKWSLY